MCSNKFFTGVLTTLLVFNISFYSPGLAITPTSDNDVKVEKFSEFVVGSLNHFPESFDQKKLHIAPLFPVQTRYPVFKAAAVDVYSVTNSSGLRGLPGRADGSVVVPSYVEGELAEEDIPEMLPEIAQDFFTGLKNKPYSCCNQCCCVEEEEELAELGGYGGGGGGIGGGGGFGVGGFGGGGGGGGIGGGDGGGDGTGTTGTTTTGDATTGTTGTTGTTVTTGVDVTLTTGIDGVPIPEPSTWITLTGMAGIAMYMKYRRDLKLLKQKSKKNK